MAAVVGRELHRGIRARQRLEDLSQCHRIRSFPVSWSLPDTLLVQAEQAALAVVSALERAVRLAVVELVELVFGVERRGVQRLVPGQPGDLVLHEAVVVAVCRVLAGRQRHGPPEPEVHVHLAGPERVEGPGALAAQPQRAHPYRTHPHICRKIPQELGAAFDRDLDVLDHRLARREVPLPRQRAAQAVAAVQGDQLPVHVRAPVAPRPQPPDHWLLHSEWPRAPEPVGVPAPQVVADGEEVFLVPPDRLVVDLLAGVIAAPRGHVAVRADGEVKLVGRERGPVQEIGLVAAVAALRGDLADGLHAGFGAVEREVAQVHVRPDRLELDGEREAVAERPVGVREAAEQVGVLVVVGGDDNAAVAGEDLHLGDGLVRHAVAQRGGLDAQAGDRAAEGDRLELRYHHRHQLVREGRVAEILVGGHAADAGRPGDRIDAQHVAERGDVEPGRCIRFGVTEPEQVGRVLGQPYRRAWRQRRVGLTQSGDLGLMRAGGRAGIHHRHPFRLRAVTHYGNGRGRTKGQDPYRAGRTSQAVYPPNIGFPLRRDSDLNVRPRSPGRGRRGPVRGHRCRPDHPRLRRSWRPPPPESSVAGPATAAPRR